MGRRATCAHVAWFKDRQESLPHARAGLSVEAKPAWRDEQRRRRYGQRVGMAARPGTLASSPHRYGVARRLARTVAASWPGFQLQIRPDFHARARARDDTMREDGRHAREDALWAVRRRAVIRPSGLAQRPCRPRHGFPTLERPQRLWSGRGPSARRRQKARAKRADADAADQNRQPVRRKGVGASRATASGQP